MTDTLERREAIAVGLSDKIILRLDIGEDDPRLSKIIDELRADLAALSLPAREVSGNDVEASAWAWLDQTFGSESDDPVDRAYAADEMVDAFHAGRAALTTTPAPREMEACCTCEHDPLYPLNRLSGEG